MSKKRANNSKKKKINNSSKSNGLPKMMLMDYTFRDFPDSLYILGRSPLLIIKKRVHEILDQDASIEEIEKEFRKQQLIWNELPQAQKDEFLNHDNLLFEDSEKFWDKNYELIISYKFGFSSMVTKYLKDQRKIIMTKGATEYFYRIMEMIKDWRKLLNKHENSIIEIIDGETTKNTMAAVVNLFTLVGLTNMGQSYVDVIRTLQLRQNDAHELMWNYIPEIMKYAIANEKIAISNFIKNYKNITPKNIPNELLYPKHNSYRYISYSTFFDFEKIKENTKFDILKTIISKNEENYINLFSEFIPQSQKIRASNRKEINTIQRGKMSIYRSDLTSDFQKEYQNIDKNISYVRNMLLSNKKDFVDLFLNGSKNELQFMEYWLKNNTDKSILAGMYALREAFEEKDREIIISKAIDAQIAHNTDLLTLKEKKLFNWLVLGLRELG